MEVLTIVKKCSIGAALLAAAVWAQDKPAFEVASIKPAAPLDPAKIAAAMQSGAQMPIGPRIEAHRAEYLYMNLKTLIVYAYQVRPYQVSGPDWLEQDRFDIFAKYPDGATKADAPRMLQSLLEDRFKLKVHKSTEEHPVLGLVVARGGSKLKQSAEKPMPIDEDAPLKPGERKVDGPLGKPMIVRTEMATGAATVDLGEEGKMSYKFNRTATPPVIHIDFSMVTMPGFAAMLSQILSQVAGSGARQIVDMTHIEGHYEAALDLSLEDMIAMVRNAGVDVPSRAPGANGSGNAANGAPVASDPGATGLSLSDAVRALGLRLEPRQAPVEQLIVDHAERKPTEN